MFDKLLERWAATSDPRFQAFIAGKEAYESFGREARVGFEAMTDVHYVAARADARMLVALRRFTEAAEMSEQAGALADMAVAKYHLGMVRHARGELDEAKALMEQALGVLSNLPQRDRAGDTSGCHYHLGLIAMKQGRLPDAVRELRRSRQLDEARADLPGMQLCDRALAACAEAGADLDAVPDDSPDKLAAGKGCADGAEPASEPDAPLASEIETGPVRYDRREAILLASYSVPANDALMAHVSAIGDAFGRPVTVSRVAFGAPDPEQRRLPQANPDQHLCATVLILEKAGMHDPLFQELADAGMQRVLADPGFRLLVYLHDLTMQELRDLSDSEPFVARLFDTTQIAESPSLEQLRHALVPFIRRVERLEGEAAWRSVRLALAALFGRMATVPLLAAALFACLGFPAWLLKSPLTWLGPHGPTLASLALGMLAFPLQAPLIFLLLRGMRTTALAPRDNVILMRWVGIGAVIMMGGTHLQQALRGPVSWVWLGLAFGVLLDAIRRAGHQARRQAISLESQLKRATDQGLQEPESTVLRGDPLNPFSCPLIPLSAARVFISYTRSSSKGIQLATALHRGLEKAGAMPFLDRASIPAGANWRKTLNRHIGECEAFICILDEKSVQREWVAAELLATLEARRLTGTPDIVIVMDPVVKRPDQPMLPVFRGVVSASGLPPVAGRPQIVTRNEQTQAALVWSLAPGRFVPKTVFTPVTALPLFLAMTALGVIGGLGILTGPILGFLAMLERAAGFPFGARLADRGWSVPVALLSALWLGFTARAAIGWKFEEHRGREMGAAFPAVAAIGLAMTCFTLSTHVSALLAGWAVVLGTAGWLTAASAAHTGEAKSGPGCE